MGGEEFGMARVIHSEDQGKDFGKWDDPISRFMYHDSMIQIIEAFEKKAPGFLSRPGLRIADYGGGNGLLKAFFPEIISIDHDISKEPDIADDIMTHEGEYDLIIIRYVLHYLNDYQVIRLFEQIQSFHKGPILIIQFTNPSLRRKYRNSKNEFKYFRTERQLEALIPDDDRWPIYWKPYRVTQEFYFNRLKIENAIDHREELRAYILNLGR